MNITGIRWAPLTLIIVCEFAVFLCLLWGYKNHLRRLAQTVWEKPETMRNTFPRKYSIFFHIWLFGYCIIFTVSAFVIPPIAALLQRALFQSSGSVLFLSDMVSASIFFSVVLGITLGGVLWSVIVVMRNPHMEAYIAVEQRVISKSLGGSAVVREAMRKKIWAHTDIRGEVRKFWNLLYIISIVGWVIVAPFFILLFDYYTQFMPDRVVVNHFLSLREQQYAWNDIQTVTLNAETSLYKQKPTVKIHFQIFMKDGTVQDLWPHDTLSQSSVLKLKTIVNLLKKNNISIDVRPLTLEQEKLVFSRHNVLSQSIIRELFFYAGGIRVLQ